MEPTIPLGWPIAPSTNLARTGLLGNQLPLSGQHWFSGHVCKIQATQDSNSVYLRQREYDEFGILAGTTVSVTELDNGSSVVDATLEVDDDIETCVIRISESLRHILDLAGDTDIEPPNNRPVRQFSIRVSQQ